LRRAPGLDASLKAARAAFIAGAVTSSNVLAGHCYGIPPSGTMAHSYVEAFPSEIDAFRAFARAYPGATTLLIDTYDTVNAARKAVQVGKEMEARGHRLAAVRLDSGDIATLSREVRRILDDAGLPYVRIFVSGGLDEHGIAELLEGGAPIDAFGVGTRMDVSADAPYLDMAYKLVRYAGRNVLKISPGKETWTGEKQVYRTRTPAGLLAGDLLALREEPPPDGGAEPLLRTVMAGGAPVGPPPPLSAVRDYCAAQVAALPEDVRRLVDPAPYPVCHSQRLRDVHQALKVETWGREVGTPEVAGR
jgi:nicotinate phosphoribosyltransferase